jgi:hypothetical protein
VQVEDGLPRAFPDVDDNSIILETLSARGVGDEVEHPLRLVGRKRADLPKTRDVSLRQHEQVRGRLRVDVADRDEAVRRGDVVAVADERAEETVLRQRESPSR